MEYVKYDPKQRAEFKKNLKRLMNEKGVTKTQLSKKLGWSYNTIDYWIRGDRVPDRTGSRLYAIISESMTWNYWDQK